MSDADSPEPSSGPLASLLALPALVAWVGIPTPIFGFLRMLALAGLVTTLVRFSLFGGGSRPEFDSTHRSGGWDR